MGGGPAMQVAVTVLGRFAVAVDGLTVDPAQWNRRSASGMVKVLALAPGFRLHREQLMDRLWPDVPVEDAAPRLHKAAHYARRALGETRSVVLAGDVVALFPDRELQVDAVAFQSRADAAISANDATGAGRAADLYGGNLLPDDLYEDWTVDARERLRSCYLAVLRLAGRWEILTREEPTDEEAHLRIVAALAQRGDHRGALRQYERLERALRTELGVAPSKAAIALRERLVAGQEPTAGPLGRSAGSAADSASAPAPPVGRDDERDRIRRLFVTVTGGSGRTLFISGAPGIGKTALLDWLEHAAADLGMRVGTGVAAQVEGAWPYAPVLEAVADLSRRHPTLLDGLDDALREQIEMGLSGTKVGWAALGGHQRLFVAVAELLRLAAAGSGAVLVIDDAHLADDASLRLLHYLARSTAGERVLVVVAHRPEPPAALADIRRSLLGRANAEAVDLGPLSQQDVSRLVRRLSPQADANFTDAVGVASAGVPFAVVELVRSGLDPSALPSRSLSLGALSSEQITALAAAAVLGNSFDTDEFLSVAGLPDEDAYAVLDTARSEQLVVRTSTGYAFRHSLLRDAILERLPGPQRRALHRRAADALMALDRSPARIGHQLVAAGDRRAAVPWMLRAAETSAALGAYREALDLLAGVRPQTAGAELAMLLAMRADLLMACADAGAVDAYREALAAVDEPTARGRLRARLARAATFAGDAETATIALDGLTTDGSPDDAVLLLAKGHLAFFQGDMEAADAAAAEARQRVTLGVPSDWQMFDLITLQGLVAHTRGEWFLRLRAELRAGVDRPALATRIFDSHLCVAEYLLYGPTPYQEVLELAASLRDTAERSGVLRAVAFATALRGETALLMGDLDLAEAELREAADLHRDIGSTAGEAHSLQRLAEVALERGDRAEANRLLLRALPLARFSNISPHLIQRVYGTMIAAAPDPVAAREVVARAEAALGASDYCPFCSIMLSVPAARACADVGDLDDARRHLQAAERSAVNWEGTAWQASLLEVRAHLAAAEGATEAAQRLRSAAADLFDASGQPLDARRCRR